MKLVVSAGRLPGRRVGLAIVGSTVLRAIGRRETPTHDRITNPMDGDAAVDP
jgi:hypothetical protein